MAKTTVNPHIYGAGTRLSSAYTIGRDGKPCPRHCADRSSHGYAAWKLGHDEFCATQLLLWEQRAALMEWRS